MFDKMKLTSSFGRHAGQIFPCSQVKVPETFNTEISFSNVDGLYSGWLIISAISRASSFVSTESSFQAPQATFLPFG